MNDEETFLALICGSPADYQLKMVFADWLRDRDDPRASAWDALAGWRIAPHLCAERPTVWDVSCYMEYPDYVVGSSRWRANPCAPAMIPEEWFDAIDHPDTMSKDFDTVRAAYDALVVAYLKLTDAQRHNLVGCRIEDRP